VDATGSREEAHEAAGGSRSRGRRAFSLSEKIAIVRETLVPGMTSAQVARRHGIHLNLLYYWRRVYKDLAAADLEAALAATPDEQRLADLRLQVRNLERLLGQRTLEVALLREQLEGHKR
jgi:transposase